LLRRPERHYASLQPLMPFAEECLVVPVYVDASPVGSLWAVAHDDRRQFDVEDLRQMQSLATLVDLHGGSVVARSDGPGQGSSFTVTLPTTTT